MRPVKLCHYVNQFLLLSLEIKSEISETTAVRWLKKLGFKLRRVQKGVFIDGHEREDVVKARTKMIEHLYKDIFPWVHSIFSKSYTYQNITDIAMHSKARIWRTSARQFLSREKRFITAYFTTRHVFMQMTSVAVSGSERANNHCVV